MDRQPAAFADVVDVLDLTAGRAFKVEFAHGLRRTAGFKRSDGAATAGLRHVVHPQRGGFRSALMCLNGLAKSFHVALPVFRSRL